MTPLSCEAHDEFRLSVRQLLAEVWDSSSPQWPTSELTSTAWRRIVEELGLPGIAIPSEYGGCGRGPRELGIVLEEMGRVLFPGPFFATVALAAQALLASNDTEAKARWLPRITDGSLTATLAVGDGDRSPGSDVHAILSGEDECWALTGTACWVVDGDCADLLLVVAHDGHETGLFAIDGAALGVRRTRLDALDATRRIASVEFDRAPAVKIVPSEEPRLFVRRVLDLAVIALAAEQAGGARACLDAAVGYAKTRVQFGRPIGSFQAVKHMCTEMLVQVECAIATATNAAAIAAPPNGDKADLHAAAALAGACCSEAFTRVSKRNIQVHGGIGFTWSHHGHRYLRRAKSSELLLGMPALHRSQLAPIGFE